MLSRDNPATSVSGSTVLPSEPNTMILQYARNVSATSL
jgi:hypothetical protein